MVRWVKRVLRRFSFVIGVLLTIVLVGSIFYGVQVLSTRPDARVFIWLDDGAIGVNVERPGWNNDGEFVAHGLNSADWHWERARTALCPSFERGPVVIPPGTLVEAWIPLWLPALLFLAWPVTSFIVARRRRKARGFEVETKLGNAVSTADS